MNWKISLTFINDNNNFLKVYLSTEKFNKKFSITSIPLQMQHIVTLVQLATASYSN